MSTENKALVRRWFEEVWNQKRKESIKEMFAADGIAHGLAGDVVRGPEGFAAFHEAFVGGFPDLRVAVEDVVAEGDRVAIRWRVAGTLKGPGLGVAPTNRPMSVTGMSFVRIRGGQIVEGWNNFDVFGMHEQAGSLAEIASR
jgi:steroid delta-isomerase-like uncharacterized protein